MPNPKKAELAFEMTAIDVTDKIKGGAAIEEAIKLVHGSFKKSRDLAQSVAYAIVQHASIHGDCDRALKLVRALPSHMMRPMVVYFMSVSPIGVRLSTDAKDDKVRFIDKDSKSYVNFDLDKAKALMWWTLEAKRAEQDAADVFASGVFDKIIKDLDRIIKNENKREHYTDDAVQAAMQLKRQTEGFRAKFLAAAGASTKANDDTATKMKAAAA